MMFGIDENFRSDSGVVNMYDTETCFSAAVPKPLKAIMNLTTTIDDLTFNHTRFGAGCFLSKKGMKY
jgi:hypothetical protein